MNWKNNPSGILSKLVAFIIFGFLCFWWISYFPKYTIAWDVLGYYYYLPLAFYQDGWAVNMETVQQLNANYEFSTTLYQFNPSSTGNHIIRYPAGLSYLYAPFFGIAHVWANWGGYAVDGLSRPYHMSVAFGCVFYLSLGFWMLRKVLINYFSDVTVALSLLTLFFGTNLYHQAIASITMPHTNLFFVYAYILYTTMKWHEQPTVKRSLWLGFFIGLATAIRPTEILSALIPFFWGLTSLKKIKQHVVVQWKHHKKYILIALGVAILMLLPQIIYWKVNTGHFFHNSYKNPGEGLDFFNPHLWDVLFSYRKGWLVYTPMVLFMLGGILILRKKLPKLWLGILVFAIINTYIVSCWTNWWYADSFGSRALVQSYALLAIPFCAVVSTIRWSKLKGLLVFGVILLLVGFNQFQIWQMSRGILHGSRMTKTAYWAGFTQTQRPKNFDNFLLINRDVSREELKKTGHYYEVVKVTMKDFESAENTVMESTGNHFHRISNSLEFDLSNNDKYRDLTEKDHLWVRASFDFKFPESGSHHVNFVMTMSRKEGAYKYQATKLLADSINHWKHFEIEYLTPHIRSKKDDLSYYFWNRGKTKVDIDNFKVEILEETDYVAQ